MSRILFLVLSACNIAANASELSGDQTIIKAVQANPAVSAITISSDLFVAAGTSATFMGSNGFLQSDSSITASGFFGDGSNLAGIASLGASHVFSGANTFSSSVTVQSGGRPIALSTDSVVTNIDIGSDGVVTFYPELHNSSHTIVPEAQTTRTTFGPCIAGSTITILTSGGRVELNFSGMIRHSASRGGLSFLQDGLFVRDLAATKGIYFSNGYLGTVTFSYLLDAPSAGTHSYCITIANLDGLTTTLINSIDQASEKFGRNIFFAKEIK